MSQPILNIHGVLPRSLANGPGPRAVLWVQGCSRHCPGCFNPETHVHGTGRPLTVEELMTYILSLGATIEGVTISGGEPLEQAEPLLALLKDIRARTSLSTLLFTGYPWDEIQCSAKFMECVSEVDVVIAGPYDCGAALTYDLRGSTKKTVHFMTNRYTDQDLQNVPCGEVVISETGEILTSGVHPVRW